MIRVLVADDHHLVRQGIRALLERAKDIQVVGEAADGLQVIQMVKELKPDVLVLDVVMPLLNGSQVLEQLQTLRLATRTVILSMYSDETIISHALRNGARGYLLKRSVAEELPLAVRAAHQNEIYLSPPVSSVLVPDFSNLAELQKSDPFEVLTPRELEVFKLIVMGHTNSAIAKQLNISDKTVEKHRSNLMEKLNIHDLSKLVRLAIKFGIISLDE